MMEKISQTSERLSKYSLAPLVQASDDAPLAERPQAHADIAAADVEAFHHIIGAEGNGGDVEQRMDLGHGAVDAPCLAHLAPAADEEVLGSSELLIDRHWRRSKTSGHRVLSDSFETICGKSE